jgi:FtsZ-binding cell division protein ZapB
MRAPDWNDDLELVSWLSRRPAGGFQAAIDEITRLTAEVEWHKKNSDKWQDTQAAHLREVARLTAENEKLRAALRVWCEAELNAYYRMKYPGGHPHSQKELAQAMASNPATVALKENNNDQG